MKKNFLAALLLIVVLLFSACTSPEVKQPVTPQAQAVVIAETVAAQTPRESPAASLSTEKPAKAAYIKLTPQEAKARMDSGDALIVVDVREASEFEQGHVPGAILLPLGQINDKAAEVLPEQDAEILVYCRSGSRSRQAANLLLDLGYTRVFDFGGIIDWPYETVK